MYTLMHTHTHTPGKLREEQLVCSSKFELHFSFFKHMEVRTPRQEAATLLDTVLSDRET